MKQMANALRFVNQLVVSFICLLFVQWPRSPTPKINHLQIVNPTQKHQSFLLFFLPHQIILWFIHSYFIIKKRIFSRDTTDAKQRFIARLVSILCWLLMSSSAWSYLRIGGSNALVHESRLIVDWYFCFFGGGAVSCWCGFEVWLLVLEDGFWDGRCGLRVFNYIRPQQFRYNDYWNESEGQMNNRTRCLRQQISKA